MPVKNKVKVFITRNIPLIGVDILKKAGYEIRIASQKGIISKKDLYKGAQWCDILVSLLTDTIDAAFLQKNKHLKGIVNFAVGFNNIDIVTATKLGIPVGNSPAPEVTETVADFTLGLMLATGRRITESDTFTRAGKYKGWEPLGFLGRDLYNTTIGIIGMGRIGQAVAQRCAMGFNCTILYFDPRGEVKNLQFQAKYVRLQELLKKSDYISINALLSKETYHLLSTNEFRLMKSNTIVINTARGPIIDEKALLRALDNGLIAGAGLDVYEAEPAIDTDPNDHMSLKKHSNVVMTSHIASASIKARNAMSEAVANAVKAIIKRDKKFRALVNPSVFDKK